MTVDWKSLLFPLTSRRGRRLRSALIRRRRLRRHDIIHLEALRGSPLRFLQIGANDGVVADPLHPFIERFGWTGVLVEPQSYVFSEKLEPLYRSNPGVQCVNVAIGLEAGTMPLFQISFSNERWATGKASLNRGVLEAVIASGRIDDLAQMHGVTPPSDRATWITSTEVPILTASQLLDTSGLRDFDLLHVDTEGADGVIVRQFDFNRLSTRIVQFEHSHLDQVDFAATCEFLAAAGFGLFSDDTDVLAIRPAAALRTSMENCSQPWTKP